MPRLNKTVAPVDYVDKLPSRQWYVFTPPKWRIFTPPLTARSHRRAATGRAPAVTGPDAPITRHVQRAPARTAPLRQNAAATSTNPPDNGVNAGFGQQSRRQATGCLPKRPFAEIISPVDNHLGDVR